jgi:hypothetical protein
MVVPNSPALMVYSGLFKCSDTASAVSVYHTESSRTSQHRSRVEEQPWTYLASPRSSMQSNDETIALSFHDVLNQVALELSRMHVDQCFYDAAIVLGYDESIKG